MLDLVSLPMSAPSPAPTAIPRTGTKNSSPNRIPQNAPQAVPALTAWWLVWTWYLPSVSRMITAIASGWMMRSWARRRASSAAASAVVMSGYPMDIRSDMAIPFCGGFLACSSGLAAFVGQFGHFGLGHSDGDAESAQDVPAGRHH